MTENINDLLFFSEVARAGSITAAARRTGTPKSTISRRLIRLEERIGAKLFHKTTRKIVLTGLGETYLERCERVVREVEDARAYLESVSRKAEGALRVTMPADVGIYWLAPFFAAFLQQHPGITFDLDFTGRRVDLIGERYDVAIRGGNIAGTPRGAADSYVARRFLTIERALYASPGYLAEADAPAGPDALSVHRFILLEAHTHPRPSLRLTHGRQTRQIEISGPVVSNSLGMVRSLALEGCGIAAVPVRMCAAEENAGALVRVLPRWVPAPLEAYYVIPERKLLPARTRLFVNALAAYFAGPRRTG